jgi:hypothetical protein
MARTTADLVKGILDVDEDISLTPFINAANVLVTEACGSAGYEDDHLQQIETWLAAHFYCSRDPRVSYEVIGPLATTFQYKNGLFLANTSYGQMALTLDVKGGLAQLSKNMEEGRKKTTAGVYFLGTTESCPTE